MTASLAPLPRLSPAPFGRAASAPPMATLPLPAAMSPEAVPAASSPLPPWPSPAPVFTAVPETSNAAIIRSEELHSPVEILHSEDLDFTDSDLMEAFGPIVDHAVRAAMHAKENGIDTYLEPMLRATIRRAIAESSPGSRPFNPPGAVDRLVWHLQALFTSRTYEDIFFEKTHRFQVGEFFLVDASPLALVSFASCDPARHASPRRVESSVQRLALQLRDDSGTGPHILRANGTKPVGERRSRSAKYRDPNVGIEQIDHPNSAGVGGSPCGGRAKVSSSMEPNRSKYPGGQTSPDDFRTTTSTSKSVSGLPTGTSRCSLQSAPLRERISTVFTSPPRTVIRKTSAASRVLLYSPPGRLQILPH